MKRPLPDAAVRPPMVAGELDAAALIAALPDASLIDCRTLAAEAGQRSAD